MGIAHVGGAGLLILELLAATPGHAASGVGNCVANQVQNGSGDANGGTYYTCQVNAHQYPHALCNDGTAAAFQIQPAADRASTKWLIWLEGGYACYDASGCAARAGNTPKLVSANGWGPVRGEALLSHDPNVDPALADANTVLVHYCSSDAWSGNFRARNLNGFDPSDISSWNFEGRAVMQGVVATLVNPKAGFGMAAATQVVLGGSSAGGNGVTYVANDVLPMLPSQAQVLLVQDAGFTINVDAYDADNPPHYEATGQTTPNNAAFAEGRGLWHGHGDSVCDAQAQTVPQHIACYDTSVLLQQGYVSLPTFVTESLLDEPEVSFQICPPGGSCNVPTSPNMPKGIYATYYAAQSAQIISENGASSLPYTAYSPDIYVHTMLNSDGPFGTTLLQPQNLTPRDVFNSWYANPTTSGTAYLGTSPGVQKPQKY